MNASTSKDAQKAVSVSDDEWRRELLSAVWYTCSKIVEEEEVDLKVIATEAYVASLAELVYAQVEALAQDLEAFSKHAGRTCISTEDVLLACRKHPELPRLLRNENRHRVYKNLLPFPSDHAEKQDENRHLV